MPEKKNSKQTPQFENKVIEQLYKNGLKLPPAIVKEILDLPEESLQRDLKKVLKDGVERYNYFNNDQDLPKEHSEFLIHAIFIMAEKEWTDCLQEVLDIFKNGQEFCEFYFAEVRTEYFWASLFRLAGKRTTPLFEFLKDEDVDAFSRMSASVTLEQYYYYKDLQQEIINGYKDLAAFFLNKKEYEEEDSVLVTGIISEMANISPVDLDGEIRQLYEQGLVQPEYAGDYKTLLAHRKHDKQPVPSIYTIYKKMEEDGWQDSMIWEPEMDDDDNWTAFPPQAPVIRMEPKVGRNDPCPCGSGKKYKNCCMNK